MLVDDDQEISELDVESRNWNKLQENMKLIGFREGAVKGKDLSLQEGFNVGYKDGFRLGECLGMAKAIICSQSNSGPTDFELEGKRCSNLSTESCVLCSGERTASTSIQANQTQEKFEGFLSLQQSHIDELIKKVTNSNLKLYFEKG